MKQIINLKYIWTVFISLKNQMAAHSPKLSISHQKTVYLQTFKHCFSPPHAVLQTSLPFSRTFLKCHGKCCRGSRPEVGPMGSAGSGCLIKK